MLGSLFYSPNRIFFFFLLVSALQLLCPNLSTTKKQYSMENLKQEHQQQETRQTIISTKNSGMMYTNSLMQQLELLARDYQQNVKGQAMKTLL